MNITATLRNVSSPARYEDRLTAEPEWALTEASQFFEDKGAVQRTLRQVTGRLEAIGVEYAVVGGMALFRHGFRRFTEDVDLLVTRDGLRLIHEKLDGLGYLPPFKNSKSLRDVETGVRIEFLVAGEFPGDGKPKPVAFPSPSDVSFTAEGISYLNLPTLVELKLASGMTSVGRLKDLADVVELIKALNLPADFAAKLNPFVQAKFVELWSATRRRYVRPWPQEAAAGASETLVAMQKDGIRLEPAPDGSGENALVTNDPEVARKWDLHEESEYWNASGGS